MNWTSRTDRVVPGNYYQIRPDGSELTQLTFAPTQDGEGFFAAGPRTADGTALVAPGTLEPVPGLYLLTLPPPRSGIGVPRP